MSDIEALNGRTRRRRRLTLHGRVALLLIGEALASLAVWTVALALFAPSATKRRVLSLCVVAYTLGLRHALDVDHICAIDLVTRRMLARPGLTPPCTVGLYFSLGHSTIVIVVTMTVAISTGVAAHLNGVGNVGGILGTTISASFLLLIALINIALLALMLRRRNRLADTTSDEKSSKQAEVGVPPALGCMARVMRPFFRLVDKPWKAYPLGLAFGAGFDTTSEIVLLGISALARSPGASGGISTSEIMILPALFAAGMTLVDSLDACFMLYAYAYPIETREKGWWRRLHFIEDHDAALAGTDTRPLDTTTTTNISICLTVVSITIALFISLVEFMGLAAAQCDGCAKAAANDPGLSGRWWRFWIALNDNSGYMGAGVIALIALIIVSWLLGTRIHRHRSQTC
ncbi:uncharacterized protein L969DRAFT_228788 [Mixia osmundae IAM 14324]|uniref:Nickel/cobalt efflux system n=1 Tax=Mixia osmundae (strain CBS 9802 / IAM 14324 / JCM 22182 / KY 12970) TaxID=764103 RepID=G7E270_MIXOS|nr:uncharacterized protein L969DRAFT_228788 [Mixia osmundae IAM 14324]KEI36802.1 hypothetical protein L969DRAFT_228788 [Mixia osmundae IAM 14324]GAA96930.1 hypothetical protein E5Q_03604 [Mixia osmundae IAM 14324]